MEEFDKETGFITREFELSSVTGKEVREILLIDEGNEEYPVEARQHDVPIDRVPEFSKFALAPMEINKDCEYEIGLRAD